MRWLLASLRFVSVSAIALLLLAPVSRRTTHERQKPYVVLMEDASLSVRSSADSTFSLADLAEKLDDCRISHETFGSSNSTDIGEAILRHRYDDVAAIVLASDGIYNRGGNPATLAGQLGCPIYTVALGDTTLRRDAALTDLRVSRIAMLGNDFPIEVTVGATLLGGQSAQLAVNDANGRQLYTQRISYDGDDYGVTIAANLPASEPGLQRYIVHLTVADGEVTVENNTMTFFVDVIDTRRRVAIVSDAPHPDLGALKRAIESNPAYQATVVLADELQRRHVTLEDSSYSLALLHNMPSKRHPDISFTGNIPQIFVIGLQTDLSRFNALHNGLEILSKAVRANEVTAFGQDQFSLFHLDATDREAIESMPPLAAPFGEARITAGLQTLFTARIGPVDSRQPLVSATAQGEQRRAFIWGEGLWRWRLADWQENNSYEHFDRLLSQLVAFTAMQQQRDRMRVETERSYAAGETPIIRAQLYNEAYELTNGPDMTLSLIGDSVKGDYMFARDGQAYRLALPDLPEGLYHYTATSGDLNTTGTFAVEALNLEQRRLVADHNLLRAISATTGGALYQPDQLSMLIAELQGLKPVIYSHTHYDEMLRLPLVLVIIILLLAAEWVLQKYHGSI
jgi:hypothetical protein